MGDRPAEGLLRNVVRAAFSAALARLPAALGYRIACWRADSLFRREDGKSTEIARNLRLVLGDELSPAAAHELTREWFRLASCEAVDVKRLRHGARPLRRLVEIRGREHLEAALAAGKGAILCTGHFGSHSSGFSVLHASGFPVTTVGRWWYKYAPGLSAAERRFWHLYLRPVRRQRQRPNIEPWPGRPQVAVLAAAALRANEVVTISSDAAPLDADPTRAVEVTFLGRQARLLPGVVTLARLTGAPVLMVFMHRLADYRHQVLEISPPVSLEGDTVTVFGRCVAAINAAVKRSPAEWVYWANTEDLSSLGLLPAASPTGTAAVIPLPAIAEPPALPEDRRPPQTTKAERG